MSRNNSIHSMPCLAFYMSEVRHRWKTWAHRTLISPTLYKCTHQKPSQRLRFFKT